MAKLKAGEKRIQLSFQRPEDIRLFEWMKEQAYAARYDISTFIVLSLQQAFQGQIPEGDEKPNAL
jgi:hypothetical protein